MKIGPKIERIEHLIDKNFVNKEECFSVVIDRVSVSNDDENLNRIADSIQTAFHEGKGRCTIEIIAHSTKEFSNRFEADGMEFEKPTDIFLALIILMALVKNVKALGV